MGLQRLEAVDQDFSPFQVRRDFVICTPVNQPQDWGFANKYCPSCCFYPFSLFSSPPVMEIFDVDASLLYNSCQQLVLVLLLRRRLG